MSKKKSLAQLEAELEKTKAKLAKWKKRAIKEVDDDLYELEMDWESRQNTGDVPSHEAILARLADTFSSIISNNQNLVMKFLAAMTIILAIPTVVSSFFGMNVPVPFADNSHGFLYVMCIAFGISIVSAYVLWHRDMF